MDLKHLSLDDTIVACATPPGMGAIAVIRLSGPHAIQLSEAVFRPFKEGKKLSEVKSHTAHFGAIVDDSGWTIDDGKSEKKELIEDRRPSTVIDEVLINVFHEGKSFTGEETIEISCHGSTYIVQAILQLLIKKGARPADAGEFTMRAYRNGKFDLAQAEAVADLIHSTSKASAQLALNQLRGGVSSEISKLREQLMNFAGLIELELDFSEEDVEFADRTQFMELIQRIQSTLKGLMDSFQLGNAIKNGIPVAIVGEPNVGKSTLLNALLNEDRAIVSDIAGTTRDVIEDQVNFGGITFRFIDTAGIRETQDEIESKGIEKTFQKIQQAQIVLYIVDGLNVQTMDDRRWTIEVEKLKKQFPEKHIITIMNKADLISTDKSAADPERHSIVHGLSSIDLQISAKENMGIEELKNKLTSFIDLGKINQGDIVITNARHFNSLELANENLQRVLSAMNQGLPGDLLAIDIRAALQHLGEITGEITTDDLLGHIFSKFCIGK